MENIKFMVPIFNFRPRSTSCNTKNGLIDLRNMKSNTSIWIYDTFATHSPFPGTTILTLE